MRRLCGPFEDVVDDFGNTRQRILEHLLHLLLPDRRQPQRCRSGTRQPRIDKSKERLPLADTQDAEHGTVNDRNIAVAPVGLDSLQQVFQTSAGIELDACFQQTQPQ